MNLFDAYLYVQKQVEQEKSKLENYTKRSLGTFKDKYMVSKSVCEFAVTIYMRHLASMTPINMFNMTIIIQPTFTFTGGVADVKGGKRRFAIKNEISAGEI